MPHVIMQCLRKLAPQICNSTLKSQLPLMKPSTLSEFCAASINHVEPSSWIPISFRSQAWQPSSQLIQCSNHWRRIQAPEQKSHNLSRWYTNWTVWLEGLSNPVTPNQVRSMQRDYSPQAQEKHKGNYKGPYWYTVPQVVYDEGNLVMVCILPLEVKR